MTDLDDLRDSVRGFLDAHAPVRGDGDVWPRLTGELGLTGLAVPESAGGAGASWVELAVALEETGRVLLRAPYLPTVVAAAAVTDASLVAELAGGGRAALALDGLDQVVHAAGADVLLVADGDELVAHRSFRADPLESLDVSRPQARVVVEGDGARVGSASAARDLLHVALAAEAVGAARRCVELTVAHLKVREQFGRPLGSFQALRHRVADMTVAVEGAASMSWYAARAAAQASVELPHLAPLAKATAADAFTYVAGETIQLHGGIGFTWEHEAHLYFKRAWSDALLHGDSRTLRRTAYDRARALR